MKKLIVPSLIPMFALIAAGAALLAAYGHYIIALAFVALGAAAALAALFGIKLYRRSIADEYDDIFNQNSIASARIINDLNVPCLIFGNDGRIIWSNSSFKRLYSGSRITDIVSDLNPQTPNQTQVCEYGGRSFQLFNIPVERRNSGPRRLTFQYWIDRTEALHYSRIFEERVPIVALIYVDNYDDLIADKQFRRSAVMVEVEQKIAEFTQSVEGIYRRYDNTKFMMVFESSFLREVEKNRFPILESIRDINTGTPLPVTLSIAVGEADRILASDESARLAMELALGRGGDQAVVKRGATYAFYGGKRQVTTKSSKVKTRLFAKALRQMMENATDIYIMGHRNPDMDCMGATLGLMRCARHIDKRAYFVLDESNSMIETALVTMRSTPAYNDLVKTPDRAMEMLREGSVLIVVDTQREGSVMSSELLKRAGKTVVIDHHRRAVDSIADATLNYLEAGASSACEMVTEIMQYFDENLRPTAFECGTLLAGITVDTKRFAFNTGSRTFDAASYLRRNGADIRAVKLMFQDDMSTYKDRARVVQSAELQKDGVAISVCPEDVKNAGLIAAQASDELISIKGIRASFVLSYGKDAIIISGRSIGNINVQLILEKLGGGGHLTVAGAQLKGASMTDAIKELKSSINEYFNENPIDK